MSGYPLLVKRDLDGFFGLAIDNLVQLLLIVALCGSLCGMSGTNDFYIYRHILPGVAVSLLIGNLFYAAQAHWVARRERRSDVTALPYGINTPSLLVYIFFVMQPAYERSGDAGLAWRLGLVACLGSGVMEFIGAFVAERLRRNTPRAALLSTLAGIAITFISLTFALQIWQRPLVAMVPLAIVLMSYFGRARFAVGLPGGLLAVLVGTGLAWAFTGVSGLGSRFGWDWLQVASGVPMDAAAIGQAWGTHGWYLPIWSGTLVWQLIGDWTAWISLLSVIIPMGLFNVIGSLQNIESAEAAGDVFPTGPSLAVNGIGTIAAALFGSCFPTTIYIGHPAWKSLGARAGYSWLNGLVMSAICLTGTVAVISRVVPLEAGIGIVLWIGVIITAQAFQASPLRHAPAVAIGLFPAIAAWGATVVAGAFIAAGANALPPAAAEQVTGDRIQVTAEGNATTQAVGNRGQVTGDRGRVIERAGSGGGLRVTASQVTGDRGQVIAEQGTGGRLQVPASQGAVQTQRVSVPTMQDLLASGRPRLGESTELSGFLLHGMLIMDRGYIFTCMIVAAIAAFLIDRRFYAAAGWATAAAVLTALGLMHSYQLSGNVLDYWLAFTTPAAGAFVYRGWPLVAGYLLMAAAFVVVGRRQGPEAAALPGDTLHSARLVSENDLAAGE